MADNAASLPLSQVQRHGQAPVYRLEFHMSSVCDQRCVFCSESDRMAAFARAPISYRSMVETLVRKRRDGCTHVTFTGGEPTLHPRFLDVLRAAKRLGYSTYVTTDASRLASKAYAEEALPLLDEICISVHGHRAEIHDPLAQSPGSFQGVLDAIAHIGRAPKKPYLLTNTVVTKANIDSVVPTVRLLTGLGPVRHCTISNLAPDGAALKDFRALSAPLADIGKLAAPLSAVARETGIVVRFFGVPLCVLGGDWELPNDLHWTPRVTVERGIVDGRVGLQEIFSPHPGRQRFYAPKCEGCSLRGGCYGIFKVYYDHFGDAELQPELHR